MSEQTKIVQAVNRHHHLVEALQWMLDETDRLIVVNTRNAKIIEWQDRARKAISQAKQP